MKNVVGKATGVLVAMQGRNIRNIQLDHIDAAGYWFSFEVATDDRRQTWCVRHSDLEG